MLSDERLLPEDAAGLRELFDNLCETNHIAHRSAAADQIAKRVMQLYRAGVRDRSVYLALCSVQYRTKRDVNVYTRGSKPH